MEAYWNKLWLRDVSVLFPVLLGPTSNSSFCFHSWDTRLEVNDGGIRLLSALFLFNSPPVHQFSSLTASSFIRIYHTHSF